MKLMWSLMTMRSPALKAGFSPPDAFVTTRVVTPHERSTRTGNVTACGSYPS